MNRFDNGSVSAYTPQSFQELAFVPMLKRQQHDEMSKNLAELNVIATDPLNEHRDEAIKLKQDLESKLGNLSGELASRGIDGLGKEAFYKLQKERNDLISPTGRLGQINAAKIAEAEAYKRFLTSDDAKSNSQEVNIANWKKHRALYKGYDDKNNIINIDDLGAVKYIDEQEMLSKARMDLGMTEEAFKQASSMLNDTGNSNGTRFTVNTSKAGSKSSNYEQIKAMADYFNKRINDPSDPFRKSLEYTGRDLNQVWDQMASHMNMMRKDQQSNESETSYGNVDYYNPENNRNGEGFDNVEGVPEGNVEQTQKDIVNILEQSKKIGTQTGSNYVSDASGAPVPSSTRIIGVDEIFKKGTYERNLYDSALKLSKSKNIPLEAALNLKAKEFEPIILKPDIIGNQSLFPNQLITKDINLRNANLKEDLIQGKRKLYDPKTGEEVKIDSDDWKDSNINYYGMLSPLNLRNSKMKTTDQKISPHYVSVNGKPYLMSRTSTELNTNNFAKVRRLNDVWNSMITNSDEIITVNKDWGKLGGLKLRYNSLNTNQPIEVLNKNGEVVQKMNSTKWIKLVTPLIK